MDGCDLDGNVASSSNGGGIYSVGCRVFLNESRLHANSVGGNGGGIYLDGGVERALLISKSNLTSNVAKNFGGGAFVIHADVNVSNSAWSFNSALNGGGLSISGAAKSGWRIQGGEISSNSAQQGGGIHLYSPWHTVTLAWSGGGAPYAISPDGRSVYSRGEDLLGDRAACKWGAGSKVCKQIAGDGQDGLIMGMSLSNTIAVVLVGSGTADTSRGRVIAVRYESGETVDSMEVVKISTKAVNYVASISFANENDDMVYSYGLSQAVSSRYMAVSTFYSTLAFDLSTSKFRLLNGSCARGQYSASSYSGVNALALAPDGSTLYLSRYENDVTNLRVWAVDLNHSSGACTKPWSSVEPVFRQTRSIGVSRDGLFLFVAEKVIIAGSDDDLHQVSKRNEACLCFQYTHTTTCTRSRWSPSRVATSPP
jgi:hypothetical protein